MLKDWLLRWTFWPQIIAILLGMGVLYGIGWRRLRAQGSRRLATGARLAAFSGGLITLALAMLSPLEVLQDLLFSAHMVQHLLIKMIGPPLLLLAEPYPVMAAGLPLRLRRALPGLMSRSAPFRRLLHFFSPWVSWGLYVGLLWFWHLPAAYNGALNSLVLHIAEHLSFFLAALLFWWHVTNAAPRLHGRLGYGFRIAYLLAGMAQNEILGIIITFSREPLYTHYINAARPFDISVMEDQMLGGSLMWVLGGMMYPLAALILLARLLTLQEQQAAAQSARLSETQAPTTIPPPPEEQKGSQG